MDYWTILGSFFILFFGICLIIGGIFTTYFAVGKGKYIGGSLIGLGVIFILLLWYLMVYAEATETTWNLPVLYNGLVAIIGAIIGGGAAVGLFLLAIMKS